jgi:hypothetical protein
LSLLPDDVLDAELSKSALRRVARQALEHCEIRTLRQLRQYSFAQLQRRPGMGKRVINAIYGYAQSVARRHQCDTPDLALILSQIPDRMLPRQINLLNLDPPTANALKRNRMFTFNDLRKFSTAELLSLPHFSAKVVVSLVNFIREMPTVHFYEMLENTKLRYGAVHGMEGTNRTVVPLKLLVDHHLECLSMQADPKRLERILICYWGQCLSSRQIAFIFGISHQRVTRLVERYVRELANCCGQLMLARLNTLMAGRSVPLYLQSLANEDKWFAAGELKLPQPADATLFIGRLISQTLANYHVVQMHQTWFLARANQSVLKNLPNKCRRRLRMNLKARPTLHECQSIVRTECGNANVPEFTQYIYSMLSPELHFSGRDDLIRLVSIGSSAEARVLLLLEESERALSLGEICNRWSAGNDRKLATRTVLNALSKVAFKVSTRAWGLMKHLPITESETTLVRRKLEQKIKTTHRNWSSPELLRLLRETHPAIAARCNIHIIDAIMRESQQVVQAGKSGWIKRSR